jgi:hypothetical protein
VLFVVCVSGMLRWYLWFVGCWCGVLIVLVVLCWGVGEC